MTNSVQLEKQALEAAGFNSAAKNMEQAEQDPVKEKEIEEERKGTEEKKDKIYTDEEKMKIVADMIKTRFPNVDKLPTLEILQSWKQQHGAVFCLDLGGKDIFLYRYLKRIEYLGLLNDVNWNQLSDDEQEDRIVDKCLLWPQVPIQRKNTLPAGEVKMLSQQIMTNSKFINPQELAMSTIKM